MTTTTPSDPLVDTPDATLVVRAVLDRAAFRPLYERYYVRVYRMIRIGVASDDDAHDLTQDVFIQAISKLHELQNPSRFKSWLFVIAYNRRNDYLRAWRKKQTLPLDEENHLSPAPPVEDQIIHDEETRLLYDCLGLLTEDQKEVLRLRMEGFDTKEIAAFLGCSTDAVKQRQYRALVRLREIMKEASRGQT